MIVEKAIPYSLYINMRITSKIVKYVLQEGLNESINKISFKEQINTYFNNVILLTSENRAGQWSFPTAIGNPNVVGDITFKGRAATITLNHIDRLVDICITNNNRKLTWKNIIQKYKEAVDIIDRKHNLSDEEIDLFSDTIHEMYSSMCEKVGIELITNYMHLLGAGHIEYFLTKYRNLYHFNQQGWESLNNKITTIFFHHTRKGGGKELNRFF